MNLVGKFGTILNATPVVVPIGVGQPPFTFTLRSADASRKIELSTDGGTEYFTATPTRTSVTEISVDVLAPVTHVRFTGIANDTYKMI